MGALNVPQFPAGAHAQVTPAFAESFVTVAVICVVLPAVSDAGVVLSETVIPAAGGGGVVVPVPVPVFVFGLEEQAAKTMARARAGNSEVSARNDM